MILVVPLGLLGVVGGVNSANLAALPEPAHQRDGQQYLHADRGRAHHCPGESKNAILIVEFARELRIAGRSVRQAAMEAAQIRLPADHHDKLRVHPGGVPLVFATGAGAASRQSLGTAVCGGMITATLLAVLFVPVFYVAIQSLMN